MLHGDPNPSRPPDPSSSRPRPRPRPLKPKPAPKKQPQRGLGVAQLEKLRLQEQSKHDSSCFASFHHPFLHRNHNQQQNHHHNQQQNHHHQQQPQQQQKYRFQLQLPHHRSPPDLPQFLNCGNAFLPLPPMASHSIAVRRPCLPALASPPPPQPAEENEPCLSSLSQVHDLCSPGSAISGTISPTSSQKDQQLVVDDASVQAMSARLVRPANSKPNVVYSSSLVLGHLQTESGRQNHNSQGECDDLYKKANHPALALFPASCIITEKEMQGVGGGHNAQNERNLTPFTDLCLLHPSHGSLHLPPPSRNRLESLVVSSSSTGVQARELSSFQTFPLSPAWSTGDQVLNKKRPWVLTQGPSKKLESFKGVDLNASVDEIESDSTEQDSPGTNLRAPSGLSGTAFTFRDDGGYSSSPLLSQLISSTLAEDNASPFTDSAPVPESLSAKMYMVSSALKTEYLNSWTGGAQFLSIRKGSLDYDTSYDQEAKPCGEFLTLGPSSQSSQKHRDANFWTGTYNCGFPSSEMGRARSSNESAAIWQQAKNVGKLLPMVSRVADSDVVMATADDVQSDDHNCSAVQINVQFSTCLAQKKVEGHPGHVLHNAASDSSLDLGLRLSL